MGQTAKQKNKLFNRVRRLRGQVDAIERALESEAACAEVLQLIAAARGAINGLMGEVIEDHILEHVADAQLSSTDRDQGDGELIEVIRTYLK